MIRMAKEKLFRIVHLSETTCIVLKEIIFSSTVQQLVYIIIVIICLLYKNLMLCS